jgi:hypothetical protein
MLRSSKWREFENSHKAVRAEKRLQYKRSTTTMESSSIVVLLLLSVQNYLMKYSFLRI